MNIAEANVRDQSPDSQNNVSSPFGRFDHSPNSGSRDPTKDPYAKRKWKEVMKFMKENPQIMLELMPPTPRKSQLDKAQTDFNPNVMDLTGKASDKSRERIRSKSPTRSVGDERIMARSGGSVQTGSMAQYAPMGRISNSSTGFVRPATSKSQVRQSLPNILE